MTPLPLREGVGGGVNPFRYSRVDRCKYGSSIVDSGVGECAVHPQSHGIFRRWPAAAVLLIAGARTTHAADIRQLDVTRDNGRYHVVMDVQLNADAHRAYDAFSDPALLPKINPAIQVATPLTEPGATRRLYTEVRLCVSLFCHTLHQVQDMGGGEQAGGWLLTADVLPERSEFRYGHAEWRFISAGTATDLQLHLDVEPSFWVPPLLGPWVVERMLRDQAQVTSAGIERIANS